jgi:hypothetical protein
MVNAYSGTSSYLLLTKYNNYAGAGTGDGKNRMAILDPNNTELDPISGNFVMNEVMTLLGQTPDPTAIAQGFPNAVKEWCVNAAAVDPNRDTAAARCSDSRPTCGRSRRTPQATTAA